MNEACKIEWENGLITLNEWRERLGDDTIKGEQYDMRKPEYDKTLIDTGLKMDTINPQPKQIGDGKN